MASVAILFEIELACLFELGIPCFAEAACEWLLEELVEAHAFGSPQHFGSLADFPSVEVDSRVAREFLQTQRIEVARNGLVEINATGAIGFLDSALAHSPLAIACEDAVATVDNLCHQVAFFVDVAYALLFNHFFCLWHEVVPNFRQSFLDFVVLLTGDRRTGITLDATFAEALAEVANKEAFHYVEAHESILYL